MTQRPSLPTLRHALARLWPFAALALLAAPVAARAQSAIIYGSLGNFDISNDTGQTCHGFEIDLDGVAADQIPGVTFFTANRYGTPSIVPFGTGVKVRWETPYSAATQSYAQRTLPHTVTWFPGQCYQWVTATYQDGGCEHFGVRTVLNTGPVTARWLCDDPANPGTLLPVNPPTAVAAPTYFVQPPAVVNNPPVLIVEVVAPEPAEAVNLFGNAQWIRIFKVDSPRAVALEELVADNPNVVPMDPAQLEADYAILQDEPAAGGTGNRRRKRHQSNIAPGTRAVVRRIELYRFTGQYDAATHQALCADLTCTTPGLGELGALISVQMSAANVLPDAVLVHPAGTGLGNVDSADRLISCGNKCAASYTVGQGVTLAAKPASNSDFAGWSGACTGAQLTCTVSANGPVDVTATFNLKPVSSGGGGGAVGSTQYTVSIGRSNPGTVTSDLAGTDRAISCGSACSAKFVAGTAISLTATPPAGKSFIGWGGACSGTSASCALTVNGNLSVQANFGK